MSVRAKDDAAQAFERISGASPDGAERWLDGLFTAIRTLDEMPPGVP